MKPAVLQWPVRVSCVVTMPVQLVANLSAFHKQTRRMNPKTTLIYNV